MHDDTDITVNSSIKNQHAIGGIFGRARVCEEGSDVPGADGRILVDQCTNNGDVKATIDFTVNGASGSVDAMFFGGIGGFFNYSDHIASVGNDWALRLCNSTNNGCVTYIFKTVNDIDSQSVEVGGIVGRGKSCHIENCTNAKSAAITATDAMQVDIGGICGRMMNQHCLENTIVHCTNYADVTCSGAYCFAGGITGRLKSDIILNTVNEGNVDCTAYYRCCAGGLTGQIGVGGSLDGPSVSMILNSYNLGDVTVRNLSEGALTAVYPNGYFANYCSTRVIYGGGLIGLACTDGNTNDCVYLLENAFNLGNLTIQNPAAYDGAGVGGLLGAMSYEMNTSGAVDWTVAEKFNNINTDANVCVIKNCAWLEGCGATVDHILPAAVSNHGLTSDEFLNSFIKSANKNRSGEVSDANALQKRFSHPSLANKAMAWCAGEEHPELTDVEPIDPITPSVYYGDETTYSVNTNPSENGTVTVNKKNAAEGSTVLITVKPNEGYKLGTLKVTGTAAEITVKDLGDGKYSFTMPAGKVSVAATFVDAASSKIVLTIGKSEMSLNDEASAMDVAPFIYNSRTMVPIRFIAEAFGAEVSWDGATRTVTVVYNGQTYTLVIDQTIPGFDTPAIIRNSRTMVPIRYLAEKFGWTVEWNAETRQVIINK